MHETRDDEETDTDPASVAAIVEAGSAAVAAGAVEAGVQSLRAAVRLADGTSVTDLRVSSRLVLAEALVHSLRGFDEEGLAALYEADEIALAHGDRAVGRPRESRSRLRRLPARPLRPCRTVVDRCTRFRGRLTVDDCEGNDVPRLGRKRSGELCESCQPPRAGDRDGARSPASLDARPSHFRCWAGSVCSATTWTQPADHLDASIEIAQRDHWLALLPWPQTLRGEVQLARHDPEGAEVLLRQAFARACQLGDPCWEGMSARGLAMVAAANGETARAFEVLADARSRCNRLADPYVWLDGYILDAQCNLGVHHGHPDTARWVDTMRHLASRTGMKELNVRSLLHSAALGHDGDASAAALVAADIDNPVVRDLV